MIDYIFLIIQYILKVITKTNDNKQLYIKKKDWHKYISQPRSERQSELLYQRGSVNTSKVT